MVTGWRASAAEPASERVFLVTDVDDSSSPSVLTAARRAEIGLTIDMLDADRLRDWARLILLHGADISHWGSPMFVASKLQTMATDIDKAVRDIGELRHALDAKTQECEQLTMERDEARRLHRELVYQVARKIEAARPSGPTPPTQQDLPAEAAKILRENAWELYGSTPPAQEE